MRLGLLAAACLVLASLLSGCAGLSPAAHCAPSSAGEVCSKVTIAYTSVAVAGATLPANATFTFPLHQVPATVPHQVGALLEGHHKGDLLSVNVTLLALSRHPQHSARLVTELRTPGRNFTVGERVSDPRRVTYEIISVNATTVVYQRLPQGKEGDVTNITALGVRQTYHVTRESDWVDLEALNGTTADFSSFNLSPEPFVVLGQDDKWVYFQGPSVTGASPTDDLFREVHGVLTLRLNAIQPGEAPFPTNGAYGAVAGPTAAPSYSVDSSEPTGSGMPAMSGMP